MNGPRTLLPRPRDRLYAAVTLVLAVLLLPAAFVRHPGSPGSARMLVLPPADSSQVKGSGWTYAPTKARPGTRTTAPTTTSTRSTTTK
ncbi:hypothetical protein [Nonomuraea sp. NPDC050786]|uniref:hypothetical protein n=1 Tax=Nonomuraea sp. NPDC050786 TaxID=3154840 RepID=UPI00341123C5